MKRLLAVLAFSVLATGLSLRAAAADVHPFLGAGLTFGGDTIATVYYSNGDTVDLHGGGLVQVDGGLDLQVAERVSLQGSVGYQADSTSGRNGHLTFSRYPLELVGHYRVTSHVRAGAGLRYAVDPRLSGGGVLNGQDVTFKSTTGALIEGEYLLSSERTQGFGFKVRAVHERYRPQNSGGPAVNGDHIGLFASYYF